jgi:hypothetical protein
MKKGFFILLVFSVNLIFVSPPSYSQNRSAKSNQSTGEFLSYSVQIEDELEIFLNGIANATYRISLCADVPNNEKPWQVAYHKETGHVFLILQKIHGIDTINKVFGFYPKSGLPTLLFKKVKSKVKDNSRRIYDVDVTKELSAAEFDTVLTKSILFAKQVYHINKFNCYDYALAIFNSAAGECPLPVSHVRFPFIFGRGGSPCAVYNDLQQLKSVNSPWGPYIRFGNLIAPLSTGRMNKKDQ